MHFRDTLLEVQMDATLICRGREGCHPFFEREGGADRWSLWETTDGPQMDRSTGALPPDPGRIALTGGVDLSDLERTALRSVLPGSQQAHLFLPLRGTRNPLHWVEDFKAEEISPARLGDAGSLAAIFSGRGPRA
jgi:hypothetical protein